MNKQKKKEIQRVEEGKIFIQCSFNNTLINITDQSGNALAWTSSGSCGFKGTKKSTPFASGAAAKQALEKVGKFGLKEVEVFVRGVGMGRDAAIRAVIASGLKVKSIKDTTPIPHNGPRPKKSRRV